MRTDALLRRIHRILALLFLLSMPPAAYASFTGNVASPLVYLPLFPLLGLTLTGIYFLVKPWIRRARPGGS